MNKRYFISNYKVIYSDYAINHNDLVEVDLITDNFIFIVFENRKYLFGGFKKHLDRKLQCITYLECSLPFFKNDLLNFVNEYEVKKSLEDRIKKLKKL